MAMRRHFPSSTPPQTPRLHLCPYAGNVSEAEDSDPEAFLHLFRKIGSFRGESVFSTWFSRLV